MDLFTPLVPEDRLHPNFVRSVMPNAKGIRACLSDWAKGFVDRDGKFVTEFLTSYNSSFWELYLFAVLKQLGLAVDFSFDRPDFVLKDVPFALEAAIAAHAWDDVAEWEKDIDGVLHDDLEGSYRQSIIRLSNAIHGKVKAYREKYSKLDHMQERGYIIAVSHYGVQDFYHMGDVPLQRLLLDVWEEKSVCKPNGQPVDVGLFRAPGFEDVSAVMYSSVATFGKARALSKDDGEFIIQAIRIRDDSIPIRISARQGEYHESLTDGLRLFSNPFAHHPIDFELFHDWGIRKFDPDKDGNFRVSCHPNGDLCMRQVQNLIVRS